MVASAGEPGGPFSVNEPFDDSSKKDAPDGASTIGRLADQPSDDATKAARPPGLIPDPTPPDLDGSPAGAGAEPAESPQPPWKQKQPRQAVAGDVSMAGLRIALAQAPEQEPEPPALNSKIFGLIVVATAAVSGTVAYLWSSAPAPNTPEHANVASAALEPPAPQDSAQPPATRVVPPPVTQPSAPAPISALRSLFSQSDEVSARERARQLTIKAARLWQVDASARMIVSGADGASDIDVVISGLAPGSTVSIGAPAGPTKWRLPVKDLDRAVITPPRGFVGIMDLTMELRLANDAAVDRKSVLLEWTPNSMFAIAPFPPPQLEAAEIKVMVRSGLEYFANGKVGAARLMFQAAAEAGEAAAAFALAETYDPLVLEKLGVRGGIAPDVALAQRWYEKAKELGSSAAPERLARLARRSE